MNWIETYEYDAFISHAVEDKMPIANELCSRLEQAGLKIWYSGRELRVGDRLTQTIEEGLSKSRFGIVILSPTYVNKMWTLREFYSLLSREKEGRKVVLPVLYDITPDQLAQKDLTMAELFSLRADKGIDHVVNVLTSEIRKLKREDVKTNVSSWLTLKTWFSFLLFIGAISAATFSYTRGNQAQTTDDIFQKSIMAQISDRESNFWPSFMQSAAAPTAVMVSEVTEQFVKYDNVQTYSRKEYSISRSEPKRAGAQQESNSFSAVAYDTISPGTADLSIFSDSRSPSSVLCQCGHHKHEVAKEHFGSRNASSSGLNNAERYYVTTTSLEVVFSTPSRIDDTDNRTKKNLPVTFHSLQAE